MKTVSVYYCEEPSLKRPRWPTQEGITSKLSKSTNGHQPPPSLCSHVSAQVVIKSQHHLGTPAISMNKLQKCADFQQVPSSRRGSSAKCLSVQFFKSVSRLREAKAKRFLEQRKTYRCSGGGEKRWRRGRKGQVCLGSQDRKRQEEILTACPFWHKLWLMYCVYTITLRLQLFCAVPEACLLFQAFSFTMQPSSGGGGGSLSGVSANCSAASVRPKSLFSCYLRRIFIH